MRRAIAVISCVTCLAAAALASGAFDSGAYVGKTENGYRVTFKATQHKLRDFRIKSTYTCEPGGDTYTFPDYGFHPQTITPEGFFSQRYEGTGYRVLIRGRLTGRRVGSQLVSRAKGIFKARRTYDAEGEYTSTDVALTCTTGPVDFRAHER